MELTKWLGLVAGLVVGGLYASWQWRALARYARRQREETPSRQLTGMLAGSVARIGILLIVLAAALVLLPKDCALWVVVGIAVGYGVPFLGRLILTVMRQKSKPV